MRARDLLDEVVQSLRSAPLRSFATATITLIGIAVSIVAVAIGESGKKDVSDEFNRRQAIELLLIDTSSDLVATRDFPEDLSSRLISLGLVEAAGVVIKTEPADISAVRGKPDGQATIYGIDPTTLAAAGLSISSISHWQLPGCTQNEGLIGRAAAERLGISVSSTDPTTIDVAGLPVTLIGTIERSDLLPGLADGIVVPECVARHLGISVLSRKVLVRVQAGAAGTVAARAKLVARPWAPDTLNASFVPNPTELRGVIERTTQQIVLFVGLGVVLLSGLVLAITSAVAVAHRREEIGLRRVFGARKLDIYVQILAESVVVGVLAGQVGTTVGVATVVGVAMWSGWVAVIPWPVWFLGPAAGALVGSVAGLVPAFIAARIEPRAALGSS